MSPSWLSFFTAMIVLGAILGFFSPLGCLPEAAGILAFTCFFTPNPPPTGAIHFEDGNVPGFAPILAIWAAVFMFVSLAWPLGLGYGDHIEFRSRLLTICPAITVSSPRPKESLATRRAGIANFTGFALVLGGVGTALYSHIVTSMMGALVIANSHGNYSALKTLVSAGIAVALIGCAIGVITLYMSRPGRRNSMLARKLA